MLVQVNFFKVSIFFTLGIIQEEEKKKLMSNSYQHIILSKILFQMKIL